jgi:hypothetical protein
MRRLVAFALVAGVLLGSAADATARPTKAQTIRKVTARLADKSFTRFTSSGSSSFDQRLHLCRNKSFIYDTVGSSSEGGDPDVRRVEGSWRVTSARISGRVWSARVRGVPSDGSGAVTSTIKTDGRRVTVDGLVVFVQRSDLC